jgi:hypothetical protein
MAVNSIALEGLAVDAAPSLAVEGLAVLADPTPPVFNVTSDGPDVVPPGPVAGPLTAAQLLEVWVAATDPGYHTPLLEQGEGRGLEVVTQAAAQYERASRAVDRTTQSLYILPWSGQTDEPAGGARLSVVTLQVLRTGNAEHELTLTPGQVAFVHETTDSAVGGPITVRPGRRYLVAEARTLGPGELGPVDVPALAERPGRGYDNVPPGGIRRFDQPGAGASNDGASVVPGVESHRLQVRNQPDVVVPAHVGQYVRFDAGANAGAVRRVVGYEPPSPPVHGGVALLAATTSLRMAVIGGSFLAGETVVQLPSGATGTFVHQTANRLVLDRVSGSFVAGEALSGQESGAAGVVADVDLSADLAAETGTAAWTVLRWEEDLLCTVTNLASPSGGRLAVLDELGAERDVRRADGEDDETYRRRVARVADVVSPSAVLRAANRHLAAYGGHACLREVGTSKLPGLFFDGNPASTDPAVAFAFDLDHVTLTSGFSTGTFIPGETVTQTVDGVVASGTAVVRWLPAAVGAALPTPELTGMAGVEGAFVSGPPVVGTVSGAVADLTAVTGGLQERDRWKVWLDYAEFRGFFMVGIPPSALGDPGMFYDVGPYGFYDAAPYFAMYDGFALTTQGLRVQVGRAVDAARAGGVGWVLYLERGDCA